MLITALSEVSQERGKDDDDLVANVKEHARDVHGGMEITREQILAMAEPDSEQH